MRVGIYPVVEEGLPTVIGVRWWSSPDDKGSGPGNGELQVWFEYSSDDPDDRHQQVTGVRLQLDEPLTATKLQRFPWKRMLAVADAGVRVLMAGPYDGHDALREAFFDASWDETRRLGGDAEFDIPGLPKSRPGRKGHPDEFYRGVADLYLRHLQQGVTNPETRIARELGYSRSTVAGWVATVRKKGYLPPARRRRQG